jgi:hypothetical protein
MSMIGAWFGPRGLGRVCVALACCSVLSLVLAAPALAQRPPAEGEPVEVFDYVVATGDTCERIARRFFGSPRRHDIIHAYNPSMGPTPHRLVAGTVLRLPRTAVDPSRIADARVTARERAVTAHAGDVEAWRDAPVGLELFRGWHVSTEERSSAELTFADTSILALRADTLVIIFGDSTRRVRRGGTEATVERGSLRTALGELRGSGGTPLHVVTPSSQADMRGGSAVVSVDEAGTSRVSAHEGAVTLSDSAGRGRTTVAEGMGSSVARGARPTPPRPLPPSPTMDVGALRFLGFPGRGGDVTGSWQPVAGARTYRIEIARHVSGRDLVAAVEVPAAVTNFEIHGLPAGHYFVRLATLDTDFFESRPSAPIEITVEDAAFLGPSGAPVAVPPLDPSEEPGPAELRPGTRMTLPEGVSCTGGADGELALLHGASPTCTDASGAAVAMPSYFVPALTVALDDTSLVRGQRTHVVVRSAPGEAPIPSNATLQGRGVTLSDVRYVDGALEADAEVAEDAGERASIEVIAADGSTVLSSVPATITAPEAVVEAPAEEAAAVVEEAPAPRRRAMLTAVAAPFSSSVALRAHDERGVGGTFSMAGLDEGDDGTRVRASFEMFGTLFEDQLRLSLAIPVDPFGRPPTESWRRGSTDIVASAGWLFGGERDPISVLIDLGAWLPTQGESSIGTVRLVPSFELAWAASEGFALRTRQSAILELSDTGARRWASAYGLDLLLAGPLGLILEADLTLGEERGSRPLDAAFAAAFTLDLDAVGLSVGGRFAPLGGDVFAPAEIHISFRGTAP